MCSDGTLASGYYDARLDAAGFKTLKPTVAMQQRMMKYMNVFILLLFYRSASGLCLYFIASSLWGIGERKLLSRNQANASLAVATVPAASRNGNSGGGRSQKAKQKK